MPGIAQLMDESQVSQADNLVSKVGGQHRDLNTIPHVGKKNQECCVSVMLGRPIQAALGLVDHPALVSSNQ